jgi:hypothetical protein
MSDLFIAHMLTRQTSASKKTVIDQQFNSSEKRLRAHAPAAGALRERGQADSHRPARVSGDARRDGGHDAVESELLSQQVQEGWDSSEGTDGERPSKSTSRS